MASKKNIRVRPDKEFVLVAWIDHAEPLNKQKWDIATNPDQLYPSVCWSGGFIESENDDVLEVARDHTEYGSSGAHIHILKRCIVYIHRYKVPPVTKK